MTEKIPTKMLALVISETVEPWIVAICLIFLYSIFKFIFTAYIRYFYNNVKPNERTLFKIKPGGQKGELSHLTNLSSGADHNQNSFSLPLDKLS